MDTICPNCQQPEGTHALYPYDGKCPIIRVPLPPRELMDAYWKGDMDAFLRAPVSGVS